MDRIGNVVRRNSYRDKGVFSRINIRYNTKQKQLIQNNFSQDQF